MPRGRKHSLRAQIKATLKQHFPQASGPYLNQVTSDLWDVFWANEPYQVESWGPPEDPEKVMLEIFEAPPVN